MTQKILFGSIEQTDEQLTDLAKQNGCVAFFKGVPLPYREIAIQENWILPHVYEETIDTGSNL
jgi:hypothetical protein